ncbi:hypothetical protein Tco_0549654 [Tanacetum coccineum]
MGELLSLDRVFDFLMDEPESHPAYDFLAPGPLPGYAGNPNNNNGWIEADVPLLGELGAAADEPMVGPLVDETNEPIVKAEKQVVAPVIDMEEDIAMLFGDGDFSDEDFEGFEDEEEVWEVNEELLMALVTPPPMPVVAPPSTYKVGGPSTAAAEGQSFPIPTPELLVPLSVIKDLITRMGNLKYGHGQLVKNVIQVSDAKVADDITIGEIGSRVSAIEGQVQVMASKMVQAEDGLEQAAVQQRDSQIQQLQTMVSKMSSRESTLMQCIIGMDRRLADLERRPPGPQELTHARQPCSPTSITDLARIMSSRGVTLHPELPGPEEPIVEFSEGKVGVYTNDRRSQNDRIFPTVVEWRTNAPKDGMPSADSYSAADSYFPGDDVYLTFLYDDDRDMDLFNLISAPNPTKVKTETRPRASYEVPLLTDTASRVIDMEDTTVVSGSSGTPSALEKLPLDFANGNPHPLITERDGMEDQVQDGLSHEILPVENPTTTKVVIEPDLEKEVAAMGPLVNKRRRKRGNDEANANAPPKVLRKDHVAFRTI